MNPDIAVWEPQFHGGDGEFKRELPVQWKYGSEARRAPYEPIHVSREKLQGEHSSPGKRRAFMQEGNRLQSIAWERTKDPLANIAKQKVLSSIMAQFVFQVAPTVFVAIFLTAMILAAYLLHVGTVALAAPLFVIASMAALTAFAILKVYSRTKLEWLKRVRGSAASG
jgi:small basic protein